MFERYTENARRVIFFARYEASQFGSPHVETEHLLLGLLRADKALTNRFLHMHASVDSITKQVEGHTIIREKVSRSVDLPLSNESKRVLAFAAEEAEQLSDNYIGTEHLLLALLHEEQCFAAEILRGRGLSLSAIREELARETQERAKHPPVTIPSVLNPLSRDLTQAAIEGKLDFIVGRDQEIEWIIEVLCSRNNKNPMLVGERGAGKAAVIEGLAQRIADGEVPSLLKDKSVLAFDAQVLAGWTKDKQQFAERLNGMIRALSDTPSFIIFVEEFQSIFGERFATGSLDAGEVLRPAISNNEIQCVGACTPEDYHKLVEAAPWVSRCFRTVQVLALSEEDTVKVLYGLKEQYEKFHTVSYTDEAMQFAVYYAARYFSKSPLLSKAREVLDAAGARVKVRGTSPPDELVEVQRRIKFIVHRMESAVANSEFAKARFYSDEERKEREHELDLHKKYHLDAASTYVVTLMDIEGVISRWTGLPIETIKKRYLDALDEQSKSARPPLPDLQATEKSSPLQVFLCHASKDKPAVRDLNRRLKENHFETWLDEENLLPGQDWDFEITNAVRVCQVVIVCLSSHSVNKTGYVQREIRAVLDVADEQPEGTIYVIPLKLEECEVPTRLRRWHWVSLFETNGFERLMQALLERARSVAER